MCDWEGCTTGTIRLPNPDQRSVAKTSGFMRPYIYRYTARAVPRERILALGDEGITWMGQPSRQGIALFSVRIEFWRSAASAWIVTLVIPGFNDSNDELTRLTEFLAGCRPRILRRCKWRSALQCR